MANDHEDISVAPSGAPRGAWAGRNLLRRIIPPLLVLLVAGGIYLYGQTQREQQAEQILAITEQLCEQVAAMPPGGAIPPAARQLQASLTTTEQLRTVLMIDPQLDTLDIVVVRGDAAPPYGDGSATHQAQIVLEGETRLALRYLHPGDAQNVQLIGYWTP